MSNHRPGAFVVVSFLIVFLWGLGTVDFLITPAVSATQEDTKKTSLPQGIKKLSVKSAEVKPSASRSAGNSQQTSVKAEDVAPSALKTAEAQKLTLPPAAFNRNAVGCILPLSGRFAEAGNKALDALILSSDIFNRRYNVPWKMVVADAGDSAESVREAVAYLADQAGVVVIIAIAGTTEAVAAAREAEKRKVPLILITSKEGITEGYEYVFQHFLTPTQQMQALARYSLDRLNVAIFSVLYPQDDYGEEMVRLFRKEIQKVGGKIGKVVSYSKTQTDFTEQILKLTGQKTAASGKMYATTPEARNKMFIDFEALFIPDSPLRLKMITSQLAYYDVKGFTLLGTSMWHTPDLLKKGADYLEEAVFVDSFLANGFLPETNDFVDIYYSAYSREPENIEALSYDTMEIVLGILEDEKIKSRDGFKNALLAVDRFNGATGSTYFRGNHVAQKNAFILRIQNGKLGQVR